jgi:glycosyltransferase involved in cell wall biosynthesis
VLNSETGVIVEPQQPDALAEAISTFLDYPEQRIRHGKAAKAYVETNYSAKTWVEKLLKVYQSIHDKGKAS